MSVRTEPRDLSAQLQQTLTIPAEVMTAASQQTLSIGAHSAGGLEAVPNDQTLAEANSFNTTNEHHPLERTICINIRSSLADLCLKSQSAVWSPPSAEATKSIFQQAPTGTLNRPRIPTLSGRPPAAAAETVKGARTSLFVMSCLVVPCLASRQPSLRRPSLRGFHTRTPHADPHTAPTARTWAACAAQVHGPRWLG